MKIFQIQPNNLQTNIYNSSNLVKQNKGMAEAQNTSVQNSSNPLLSRDYYNGILASNITFTAVDKSEYMFEQDFPHSFFKKLLREDLSDAYTGKGMISREDIDTLKNLGVFNKKSTTALRYLRDYKDEMYDYEKEIYLLLKKASQKHPNLTLQELLQLKHEKAEARLISNQMKVLQKITLSASELPKEEYDNVKSLIEKGLYQMLSINKKPEERFSRKIFISELNALDIKNDKVKERLIKYATMIPQSSNSIDAFIVKYSQPYKIKKNINTGRITKTPRTSEDIALKLLEPSVGTDEHIYPQTLYKQEAQARLNGDPEAQKLSKYRVTILTSQKINGEKSDMLIDDFIRDGHPEIPTNIQRHIEQLITIDEKWLKRGKIQDAAKLADYILVLRDEFELRSDLIRVDLGNFENKIPKIKEKAKKSLEAQRAKRNPNHRDKKVIPEPSITLNRFENRKNQTHTPKFKQ